MSITLSVCYCFNNFWRSKIISCVIRGPADYMAEWENVPLDPKKKKKTACKPRTASAYGRAVKKKTTCKPRTASAYGRAVKKKTNNV